MGLYVGRRSAKAIGSRAQGYRVRSAAAGDPPARALHGWTRSAKHRDALRSAGANVDRASERSQSIAGGKGQQGCGAGCYGTERAMAGLVRTERRVYGLGETNSRGGGGDRL